MKKRQHTHFSANKIAAEYKAGATVHEIAKKYVDVSRQMIYRFIENAGIRLRSEVDLEAKNSGPSKPRLFSWEKEGDR